MSMEYSSYTLQFSVDPVPIMTPHCNMTVLPHFQIAEYRKYLMFNHSLYMLLVCPLQRRRGEDAADVDVDVKDDSVHMMQIESGAGSNGWSPFSSGRSGNRYSE